MIFLNCFGMSTKAVAPMPPVIDLGENIQEMKRELKLPLNKPLFEIKEVTPNSKEYTNQSGVFMTQVEVIGNMLAESGRVTKEEAAKQVDSIRDFEQGKMSYAEMRMLAG